MVCIFARFSLNFCCCRYFALYCTLQAFTRNWFCVVSSLHTNWFWKCTPRLSECVCLRMYNLQFVCKLNKTRFDLFECFAFVFHFCFTLFAVGLVGYAFGAVLAMDFILVLCASEWVLCAWFLIEIDTKSTHTPTKHSTTVCCTNFFLAARVVCVLTRWMCVSASVFWLHGLAPPATTVRILRWQSSLTVLLWCFFLRFLRRRRTEYCAIKTKLQQQQPVVWPESKQRYLFTNAAAASTRTTAVEIHLAN